MDMGGTDSGSSTSDSSSGMMTMLSYLHFTGGDNLFFKSWQPLSRGAIAGACIGLVALALLDRFLAGVRGGLESYWSKRALRMTSGNQSSDDLPYEKSGSDADTKENAVARRQRNSPPFIFSHDVPRGIFHIVQVTISYALMLAVMSFNAAYIISIVLGLGIGEMAFGRWSGGAGGHMH